jgi:pSer/pThr/pTyr-binding forkhead associated (FHA) protein
LETQTDTQTETQTETPLELTAFIQLCLNDEVLAEYEVRAPVISIGRSPECDIVIDNAAVSAFHAILSQVDGKLFVEDAASTNGVMTDGVKTHAVELAPGESVQIAGKYSLRLVDAPTRTTTEASGKNASESAVAPIAPIEGATILVSTTTLAKMSQSTRPAYLTLSQPGQPSWIVRIEKSAISIGRKRSCDIRVGGWFAPATLATVERRNDGFYLATTHTNAVVVDGENVNGECRLEEGSRIQLGNVSGVFHERTNRANRKHG